MTARKTFLPNISVIPCEYLHSVDLFKLGLFQQSLQDVKVNEDGISTTNAKILVII